jgi:hypothetical protein
VALEIHALMQDADDTDAFGDEASIGLTVSPAFMRDQPLTVISPYIQSSTIESRDLTYRLGL